jgi:hypothetical protein
LGTEIQQERFSADDHRNFKARLQDALTALDLVLERPGFGVGERSIGAELELFLVDAQARPFPVNEQIESAAKSPLITPELGAYSIELNTPPVSLAGRPFSALGAHMQRVIEAIDREAVARGARSVPISILPTFRPEDFSPAAITDRPRYRALASGLRRLRKGPFTVQIEGEDSLALISEDIALEGANLAFQLHVRTSPDEFARMFNAALMLTGPVLAAAGNSPTFLEHRLWHETRVALFQQAGDDRPPDTASDWQAPSRTGFGCGWVREGAAELFRESVALYAPILPVCSQERPLDAVAQGGVPQLAELRLHHGTVWKWNRPVYDPEDGGHLRIELRALPSGPTVRDMLANAACLLGGMLAFAPRMPELLPAFPFALAERNFYRAAQFGLDAELAWPRENGRPESVRARDVLPEIAAHARTALLEAGVVASDVDETLGTFESRVATGITGAVWQQRALAAFELRGLSRADGLRALLETYIEEVHSGRPVHAWRDPDALPATAASTGGGRNSGRNRD